jgi:hypothetical protein
LCPELLDFSIDFCLEADEREFDFTMRPLDSFDPLDSCFGWDRRLISI